MIGFVLALRASTMVGFVWSMIGKFILLTWGTQQCETVNPCLPKRMNVVHVEISVVFY